MLKKLILFSSFLFLNHSANANDFTTHSNKQTSTSLFTNTIQSENDFLSPDQAFNLTIKQNDNNLIAHFSVATGYYLYKEKIKANPSIGINIDLPKGDIKNDPNFGKMEVYHSDFDSVISLNPIPKTPFKIHIKYQGCSEKGLCYAPQQKEFNFNGFKTAPNLTKIIDPSPPNISSLDDVLKSGNLFFIVGGFFLAGLLLSFTPCVLPMIPILSSIIVGNNSKNLTKMNTFNLSLSYVLGMATAYTLIGIAAAYSGQLLSNLLQNSFVLITTSLLFVTLSFSMFGLYELRLPNSIQNHLLTKSNHLKGGKKTNVFIMGVLSALIVSPCVAAPLVGVLIYISQTHNTVLGGIALFSLAIGMGVPLLIIGASAGTLLPKAGKWMKIVRNLFGIMMLIMAAWIVWPVLPSSTKNPIEKILGIKDTQILVFEQIKNLSDLELKIKQSKGTPLMLDFYADWCTACKELEHTTFSEKTVKNALNNTALLQIDMTENTKKDSELLNHFKLYGPPAILFFDEQGIEIKSKRIIGYKNPQQFLEHLKNIQ